MFDMLTCGELNVLQSILFEGTEETYMIIDLKLGDTGWFRHYRPVHNEVGTLFIEVGTELLKRLNCSVKAA